MKNIPQIVTPVPDTITEVREKRIAAEVCSICPAKIFLENIAGRSLRICPPDLVLEVTTANIETIGSPTARAAYMQVRRSIGEIPPKCPYKQFCG
jgi:hypothetical protein